MPHLLFILFALLVASASAPALEADCEAAESPSACWTEWLSRMDAHAEAQARLKAVTRPFDEQIEALRAQHRTLVLKHNSVGRLADLESDHARQVFDNLAAQARLGLERAAALEAARGAEEISLARGDWAP